MLETVLRGHVPSDAEEFGPRALPLPQKAQEELCFLLDHSYGIEKSVFFIGNRYQFSSRQRLALMRASAPAEALRAVG